MKGLSAYILESTIGILLLAWILLNASGFSQVIGSTGAAISGAVNSLWRAGGISR